MLNCNFSNFHSLNHINDKWVNCIVNFHSLMHQKHWWIYLAVRVFADLFWVGFVQWCFPWHGVSSHILISSLIQCNLDSTGKSVNKSETESTTLEHEYLSLISCTVNLDQVNDRGIGCLLTDPILWEHNLHPITIILYSL